MDILRKGLELDEGPITTQVLYSYFMEGCKKEADLKVGVEWEKIGVYKENGKAISYSGSRGVETIFKTLIERYGWEPVFSNGFIIALTREDGSSITLEPGGQIELSGKKASALNENAGELERHLKQIKDVSEGLGIVWLGTGVQPISKNDEIEWVPKERYVIMKENFRDKGALSHRMMKETASIQVSLDYTNEEDAFEKLRLAMALAPFFTAIFANSPISRGKPNGFLSERAYIWSQTAPERTGILWSIFDRPFGFRDYIEYALDLSMLFIVRHGRWMNARNIPFREFIKRGLGDYLATLADWELHLTTLFLEVRLKTYLEIRSVDCQKSQLALAVPAFIKGIFYDEISREGAWRLVKDIPAEERRRLFFETPRNGLETPWNGKTLLEPSLELVTLAEEGLTRLSQKDPLLKRDPKYLTPLKELLRRGKNPAQVILEEFNNENLVHVLSL